MDEASRSDLLRLRRSVLPQVLGNVVDFVSTRLAPGERMAASKGMPKQHQLGKTRCPWTEWTIRSHHVNNVVGDFHQV